MEKGQSKQEDSDQEEEELRDHSLTGLEEIEVVSLEEEEEQLLLPQRDKEH